MADKPRDGSELFLEEPLRSLEENDIKFVLKAEQKKAIRQLLAKRDFLWSLSLFWPKK